MSMTAFERQILAELREVTGNHKLKEKDLLEWTSGTIKPRDGETVVKLPLCGVLVAYPTPQPKQKAKRGAPVTLLSSIVESRPDSVILARDPEVLQLLLDFYARRGATVLDVTANKRTMWKGVEWPSVTFADIDPAMEPDIISDFRSMEVPDASYDVLVFDPPHLPAAAASPKSLDDYQGRYGLGRAPKGDNISSCFAPFLVEAARVLRPDGLIFAKLKDFVHNHAYQWTMADFVAAVCAQSGLTACDLIVKRDPCGGNLTSSKWKRAHHARNVHCWWVVVRKGRCEARPETDN